MINTPVGRAMVAQLDRVNTPTPEQYERRIADLELLVSQLQAMLRKYQADDNCEPAEKTRHGRPVLSIAEAAARAGVKYWTAYRYVDEGWWDAEQDEHRAWHVFADQPLIKKPRKSRKG